jgi:pimeloyl-ACP methyl ester carboxylesterase
VTRERLRPIVSVEPAEAGSSRDVLEVAHDGFRFDVTEAGPRAGETVVLLHGFPQTRACWDGVVPRLTDAGCRVLAPDQRGYSPRARPRPRSAYRMTRLVDDVLAVADAAGVARFHVVGHDWGGAVAWALASWRPDRVRTLTSLATPHPKAMVRSMVLSDQALRSWYMAAMQIPMLPELAVRARSSSFFRRALEASGLSAPSAERYAGELRDPDAARAALNWYRAIPFSSLRQIGSARVPTLYVYGTADTALGPVAADLTSEYVDAPYRFEPLEGQRHWIPEQAPEAVARFVLAHIGQQ